MEDRQFKAVLNRLVREKNLDIRKFSSGDVPSSDDLGAWVDLLQSAIRAGIELSDPRWRRLTVETHRNETVFALRAPEQTEPDEDFRLGLQLLMTMLGTGDDEA